MITKPKNYEQLRQNTEALSVGGHKCIIREAKEATDANGNEILVVYFDTSKEDGQPQFFQNQYMRDSRENKKWPYAGQRTFWKHSNWYEKNVSQMGGAIEASNPDTDIWKLDPRVKDYVLDLESLAGLKLGVVFGQEEYEKDGEIKIALKPRYFCEYSDAENQPAPKKKELPLKASASVDSGFTSVADNLDDDGLPFK